MSSNRHTARIPMTAFDDQDDGFGEVDVAFDWTPGSPATGMFGPPENYDPGSADEFYIVGAVQILPNGTTAPFMSCDEWDEKIAEYLEENWERPDFAAERADYEYDRMRDERMERDAA